MKTRSESKNYKDLENIIKFVIESGDINIKDSDFKYIQKEFINYSDNHPIINPLKVIKDYDLKKIKSQMENIMTKFDSMNLKKKK